MKEETKFDYSAFKATAIQRLQSGEKLEGVDGILAPLLSDLLNGALEGEMDAHLEEERAKGESNRRNGKNRKTVKTSYGPIEVETPRDRLGSFEPETVQKRHRHLPKGLEDKLLSLYGLGTSYRDIKQHFREMYQMELSEAYISSITDQLLPRITAWRSRPLEKVYPIVWMDAIHYKVREDGQVRSCAVHIVLGVNTEGHKEVLGMYFAENEGAKFWMQVLTDLQSRGVEDILIACIDNLSGFSEAISGMFPHTDVQLCVVHQVRNSTKYVASKDMKSFMASLKPVYKAANLLEAAQMMDRFEEEWGEKYPLSVKSWRDNWPLLTRFYDYPLAIRKVMYTTNPIEAFNRQLRKYTKTKGAFPTENALWKQLYLAQEQISEKWSRGKAWNWGPVYQQFHILFPDRLV